MIATLDERHVSRGYDPYNSADQPHVLAAANLKRNLKRADEGWASIGAYMVKEILDLYPAEVCGLCNRVNCEYCPCR